jgi:hypothetical protein
MGFTASDGTIVEIDAIAILSAFEGSRRRCLATAR